MIGVDEVGRGCWAGPLLVVAARATGELPAGLRDSKLLSKKQRQEALNKLSSVCQFGEGWVLATEIDELGLASALRTGIARALGDLEAETDEQIILDGKINYLPAKFTNTQCLVDADALVPIVSAASIYAKVRRDNFMSQLKIKYPDYGFETHVGYGTKDHQAAIAKHGVLQGIHRMSFKPLSALGEAA